MMTCHIILLFYFNQVIITAPNTQKSGGVFVNFCLGLIAVYEHTHVLTLSVCVCVCVMLSLSLTGIVLRRGWNTERCSSSLVLAHSTQADSELPHTWPGPHAYGGGQKEEKQE